MDNKSPVRVRWPNKYWLGHQDERPPSVHDSPRMPVPRASPLPQEALLGARFWRPSQVLVAAVFLVCGPLVFGFRAVVLGIQGHDVRGGTHHSRVLCCVLWGKAAAHRHSLLGLRRQWRDPVHTAGTARPQGQAHWMRHTRAGQAMLQCVPHCLTHLKSGIWGVREDPSNTPLPSGHALTWNELRAYVIESNIFPKKISLFWTNLWNCYPVCDYEQTTLKNSN